MNEHDSRAHRRPARGRRAGGRPTTSTTPTWWCSTPAASGRTPTTSSTAPSATSKSLKDASPGMEIVVGGCLAQKDRDADPGAGAVRRRGVRHPQRAPGGRAAAPVAHATGPSPRSSRPRRPTTTPRSPPPCRPGASCRYAAWVTIQIGCDNSCAFCIVPAGAGPGDQPARSTTSSPRSPRLAADGVTEVTLLGQNVNSYGRDLTLAARQARRSTTCRVRPLFADLLRRGRRGRRASAGSATPAPTPRTCGRDDRGHGRDAAVCEHLHLPLQSGSDRVLAAMHRGYTAERYLERLAAARAAIADLAVTTDIIVGFPGETDDDFDRTLEVAAEPPSTTAPTRSSTRPGRAPRPPSGSTSSSPGRSSPSGSSGCAGRGRAQRAAPSTRPGSAGSRRSSSRARAARTPASLTGRTRQNKLVHFAVPPADPAPAPYATVEVTGAAPHHLRGDLRRVIHTAPGTARASPSPPADRRRGVATPPLVGRAPPRGKSARGASPSPRDDPCWEIVSVDSMQVYRGMDIGTAKPTAAERAAVPHHLLDVADPWEDFDLATYQALARAGHRRHRGQGSASAAGGRHRALPPGRGRRSRPPRPVPRRPGRARGRDRHRGAPSPARRARPDAAVDGWSPPTAAG